MYEINDSKEHLWGRQMQYVLTGNRFRINHHAALGLPRPANRSARSHRDAVINERLE